MPAKKHNRTNNTVVESAISDATALSENENESLSEIIEDEPLTGESDLSSKLSKEQRRERRRAKRKQRREKRRERFLNVAPDNDIRYRGPLSYRTLRIVAWFMLFLAQIGAIMAFVGQYNEDYKAKWDVCATVLQLLGGSMTPLFLIASFSMILNRSKKYSQMIRSYAIFSVALILIFNLIYYRYLVGTLARATGSASEQVTSLLHVLMTLMQSGSAFFACNIFIDLLLCALFVTFLFYVPKKVFVGKKLIIFRLFSLLPIFYEITSITLKMTANFGSLNLPAAVGPFLTTKPVLTFVLFVSLALYVKVKERKYIKAGKTLEDFHTYFMSNYNSLRFSIFAVIMVAVIVVADAILTVGVGGALVTKEAAATGLEATNQDLLTYVATKLMACGIGQSMSLVFAIPFLLLFSYTRTHSKAILDLAIPVLAIALIVLLYLESIYQAAAGIPDFLGGILG